MSQPVFISACLISENVPALVSFYEKVLQVKFQGDSSHAQADFGGVSLILYAREAANEQMGFGLGEVRGTGNLVLMFRVADVEGEYRRLAPFLGPTLTEPKLYPWGARSFHFYDPDGNIAGFVTPP
jgi:predicted enzyme related to lactoylglutathione lyase